MEEALIQCSTSITIQPRNLFKPGTWLAKIDFINHLVLFNNVLISVLSEKRGGKTAFSTLLQNNLAPQIKPVIIKLEGSCTQTALLSHLAKALQINEENSSTWSALVDQINAHKAHVLCIIDDAHYLPDDFVQESLAVIKNQNDFSFFHLCFLSDYSLVANLNALAKEQFPNLIHTIELGALSESESRTYVLQRAMEANLIHRPLTDDQFKQFFQLTKGNITQMNTQLESYIATCLDRKPKQVFWKSHCKSLVVSGFLLASIASGFYLYLKDSKLDPILVEMGQPVEVLAPESKILSWLEASMRQLVTETLPIKPAVENLEEEEDLQIEAVVDRVVVIPKIQARVTLAESEEESFPSQLVAIPAVKPEVIAKAIVVRQPAKPKVYPYTIQLAASHHKMDMYRYKNSNPLFAKATIRHFVNTEGSWYVLTLGDYTKKKQAQQRIGQLPIELAQLNPWVRSTTDLVG